MKRPTPLAALKATVARLKASNRQLQTIVDTMQAETHQNRRDLQLQFVRLAQIQTDVDALKRSRHHRGDGHEKN